LHDLVGELSTRSTDFRRLWSRQDVRLHGACTKHFNHTVVGDLELAYESVDMISDPGLVLSSSTRPCTAGTSPGPTTWTSRAPGSAGSPVDPLAQIAQPYKRWLVPPAAF
jgi:hypothetical protein